VLDEATQEMQLKSFY